MCLAITTGGIYTARAIAVRQVKSNTPQADKSAQVDALVSSLVKENSPGAAVMVIQDGQVVHGKGYGLARLDIREPVGLNTAFDIGSTSKQFTAMAVMMLVERGKLSLDATLSTFFAELPSYAKAITIRHLLTHLRAGGCYYHAMVSQRL